MDNEERVSLTIYVNSRTSGLSLHLAMLCPLKPPKAPCHLPSFLQPKRVKANKDNSLGLCGLLVLLPALCVVGFCDLVRIQYGLLALCERRSLAERGQSN